MAAGAVRCKIDDVVDFFAKYVNEWNPNKTEQGTDIGSSVAARVNDWAPHPAAITVEEMLVLLQEDMREERRAYYGRLVRAVQMHDFHYPDPGAPPNPSQSCAQLQKGTLNMRHCKEGFPKDLVCEPCERSVAQDVHRPELWRCSLCRNC